MSPHDPTPDDPHASDPNDQVGEDRLVGDGPEGEAPDGESDHRCGFVALVGRPNVGKSTLLNQVLGQKISITSDKPQTTRNRVVGIHTAPGLQAVLLDTPGIHEAKSRMNRTMVECARSALQEVDMTCWLVDAVRAIERVKAGRPVVHGGLQAIGQMIELSGGPLVIALNKVDIVPKDWLLPVMEALGTAYPDATIVPISALKGGGVSHLEDAWRRSLPVGPPQFPEDMVTDATERFIVAELVREKIFNLTQREVPYSTAVEVEKFEEEAPPEGSGHSRGRVIIYARILVERDSQKGILIGKGGKMLKEVGTRARKDIQALLGTRVHLELHVSVQRQWTRNPRLLRELGLD